MSTGKRALWKGRLCLNAIEIPVKLYAAVEEQRVHFRPLHRKDHSPVKQRMINAVTGKTVAYADALKAFPTDDGDLVLLHKDELDALEPEPSRAINVTAFLPPQTLDHRWYERPYYLGPDGNSSAYFTLIDALQASALEGLGHWTMHNRIYQGVLRLYQGYPVLIALRHASEVVPVDALPTPAGPTPDKKELLLAKKLMDMLAAEFDPTAYHDEYRAAVLKMIATKRKGGKIRTPPKRRKAATDDLSHALAASLQKLKKSA